MAVPPTPPPTTLRTDPPAAPSGGPSGRGRRLLGLVLLTGCLLVAGVVAVLSSTDRQQRRPSVSASEQFPVPGLDVTPGSAVPHRAGTAAEIAGGEPGLRDWTDRVAEQTQIPARTLRAYVQAELATRTSTPGCKLSWATLAGVGRVESHHGRYGGADVADDGTLTRPIVGVPLDGSPGVRAIRDTDGGRLDGDRTWDRAVGAMQFLPATWTKWAVRANRDGAVPDPQNVDDSALTAARYLCASGGDLSTATGWWRAVLTYNGSTAYGRDVFSGADAYARAG